MSDPSVQTVRVNFARSFPVFPLARVSLLPHAVLPLFIFEKRYRQMVEHVLDTHGQIAMAVFRGDEYRYNYENSPAIQPAVCIGQITQHERREDGTYRIMLHGVCRARVMDELAPDDEHLYRRAVLRPIEKDDHDESLVRVRRDVLEHLKSKPLADTGGAKRVLSALDERPDLPTPAILELITLGVVAPIDEGDTLYRLLEEGDAAQRARIIKQTLRGYEHLLGKAVEQYDPDAPKGVSWN